MKLAIEIEQACEWSGLYYLDDKRFDAVCSRGMLYEARNFEPIMKTLSRFYGMDKKEHVKCLICRGRGKVLNESGEELLEILKFYLTKE